MPDIAMCKNKQCLKRNECYRFMADPNPYKQSYMGFKPDSSGKCVSFYPLDNRNEKSPRTRREKKWQI